MRKEEWVGYLFTRFVDALALNAVGILIYTVWTNP